MSTLEQLAEMQELAKARLGYSDGVAPNELHLGVFEGFERNPAYERVKINHDKEIGVHFIKKNRQYGDAEVFLISKPDNPVDVGDYISDRHRNTWLCYTYDDYPIRKNFMYLCNNTFKWWNDGKIEEVDCVLADKTSVYSDGLHKDWRLSFPDDQILVTMPNNELTSTIPLGRRIIFNNDVTEVYKVARIDKLPRKNLIDVKLRHDEFDRYRDNVELGIADYYTKDLPQEEDYEEIDINVYGDTKVLYGTITDIEATLIIDHEEVKEEMLFELIDAEGKAEITYIDFNSCQIKAVNKKKIENYQLKISLKSDENVFKIVDLKTVLW